MAAAATSAGAAGPCSRAGVGLTTDLFADPHSDVAGALIRVNADTGSPLASGVGDEAYAFYDYDPVIRAADPRHVVASYPAAGTQDFYVSGFAEQRGRARWYGGDHRRACRERACRAVRERAELPRLHDGDAEGALERALRRRPVARECREGGSTARAAAERSAVASARSVTTAGFGGIRLTVRPASAQRTRRLLRRFDAKLPRRPLTRKGVVPRRGIRAATRAGWRCAWAPLSSGRASG